MKTNVRNITLLILLALSENIFSQDARYDIAEKTGDILPADIYLTGEDSTRVKFGDLVDRPTLLAFVYYKCPGLCTPVMNGIAELIQKSKLQLGPDYRVITISVNNRETVSLARAKKASYVNMVHNPAVQQYWQFYVTDSLSIKRLTDAAGWHFKRTGNDFVHSAATILLTPHRKVSQYFYGTFIMPQQFQMAVADAGKENTGVPRPEDPKYCFNFIPKKNMLFTWIVSSSGIALILGAVILFIWLSLNRGQRSLSKEN